MEYLGGDIYATIYTGNVDNNMDKSTLHILYRLSLNFTAILYA